MKGTSRTAEYCIRSRSWDSGLLNIAWNIEYTTTRISGNNNLQERFTGLDLA